MKLMISTILLFIASTALGGEMTAVQSALEKADSLFNERKYEESRPAYESLLAVAEQEQDRSAQVEALSQIARCHLLNNDKKECAAWLAKAERLATPEEPGGWSRYLGVRGRLEWKRDDLPTAVKTFEEVFDYCRSHDLNSRAIDAVHMVAIVGTPEQQIEWGFKGIKLAEETGTTRWLGPLWNNLAITYSDQQEWEKCVDAFRKAREYHWLYGQEIHKLYADYHIGWALRMKGDHQEALTWLRPVLAWAERLGDDDVMGQTSQDIGEIAIAGGDRQTGVELLRRAKACFEREGYADFAPEILQKLEARLVELSE
ncbi:MAG: tetratricopeptide repeat protein [bacterium]